MMGARNPHLRNSAWQGATVTASAGDFSTIALYNNSIGDRLLVVHHLEASVGAAALISFAIVQGQLGTVSGTPINVTSGQPQLTGQLSTASSTALPSPSYNVRLQTTVPWLWPHEYPFAVLTPGWSLAIYHNTAAAQLWGSFYWEAVQADLYWQFLENFEENRQ